MKAPIRPKGSWTFICPRDRGLPPEEQTVFTLTPLNVAQRMRAWDSVNWVHDDGRIEPHKFRQALSLCLTNVADVTNFKVPRADTVDSEKIEYDVLPFPKKGSDDEKLTFFEWMHDLDVMQVGDEIRERSSIGDAEKNFSSPEHTST